MPAAAPPGRGGTARIGQRFETDAVPSRSKGLEVLEGVERGSRHAPKCEADGEDQPRQANGLFLRWAEHAVSMSTDSASLSPLTRPLAWLEGSRPTALHSLSGTRLRV